MKKHYPYRFKTRTEFEGDYGSNWESKLNWNREGMRCLIGTVFPFDDVKYGKAYFLGDTTWCIDDTMLIINGVPKPNYEPKKFIY